MTSYFYRGRHRAPSKVTETAGKGLMAVTATAAIALPSSVALAPEAEAGPPGGWGPIIDCESGGNPTAQNPSSTASGLFQFLDSTWQSVGGSGRAKDAPASEQYMRAERLYAQSGTSPWNASRHCWQGRTGGPSQAAVERSAPAPRPAPKAAPHKATPKATHGRAADGTGSYVCSQGTLYFEACDPGNLGQVVQYPRYNGHAAPKVKQVAVKTSWAKAAAAPADLHRRDANGHGTYTCAPTHFGYAACDPGNVGQRVAYPAFD